MQKVTDNANLSDYADLNPWIHLTMAKFSDLRGCSASYRTPLDDKQVALKLDTYYHCGVDLTIQMNEEIPNAYNSVFSIQKDPTFTTESNRLDRRYNLLHKDQLCRYPLCKSNNHWTYDCPTLKISCLTCSHGGHDERLHAEHDQIILDHMFLLFAPAHKNMGKIWMSDEVIEVIEDDWSNYLRME